MFPHPHMSEAPATGPRWNALKHGRYARAGLLPGEDPVQFARERRVLFHNYRPQTKDEADLVAAMAQCGWALERYDALQAALDGQAMIPERDAAGRVTEPIAHQRLHSSMDVTVHRQRLSRMWHRARAELRLAQQQRRQGLVPGAVKLPEGCYMEVDGTVYGPVVQRAVQPVPEPEIPADTATATASTDERIGKNSEQKENARSTAEIRAAGTGSRAPRQVRAEPGFAEGFPGYAPHPGFPFPVPGYPCLSA